ncbi:MAG TPA: bifunctional diaminohydroxyphosphoribosylaminopyrimidine deaminase/5-amino-6-(5-phosphoribosylamino)uracil reductase RibD [Candidatus Acidoferrales bacterium]|jgi:diaminohydroxyphosphoribosylaminopyrimidine deaminase/5-amino-6-(5-phosphoribosylamino)uracil reductase
MSTRSSNKILAQDAAWMERALDLARQSTALAHPNPLVGAVLVKNNRIVGEGFHSYDLRDHAEIAALKQAGKNARGATLYINMEPCCHTGRTGPCSLALIQAGVRRAVVAMEDPNPLVSGGGIRELRAAGIEVQTGLKEEAARTINEDFACWIRTGRPFVTLKTALTLDGQIAMRSGSVTWITSPASREEVLRIRHAADAILTGIGTVLSDDPRLTDRTGLPRRRKLLRCVVDSRLRLPLRSELVKSAKDDVVVFTAQPAASRKARALGRSGVEVVSIPPRTKSTHSQVDLREVMSELGRRKMIHVLIEGGSRLNGAAIEAGLVDKMILFYAPKIMGVGGVPMAQIESRWFPKSPALENLSLRRVGPDFVVEGYFHDVYGNHRASRKN